MRILSLDASTTTIGISVIDEDNSKIELKFLSHFKPNKKLNIFEVLAMVRIKIQTLIDEFQPDEIVLEDIILFMPGRSTAATISALAVLNRTVGLAVYDKTGKPPILLNVTKIRHAIKKSKQLPAKEDIPELVAERLGISFPYMFDKKGKVIVENYDRADSIAVGLAYFELKKTGKLDTVKKKKKKKRKKKK